MNKADRVARERARQREEQQVAAAAQRDEPRRSILCQIEEEINLLLQLLAAGNYPGIDVVCRERHIRWFGKEYWLDKGGWKLGHGFYLLSDGRIYGQFGPHLGEYNFPGSFSALSPIRLTVDLRMAELILDDVRRFLGDVDARWPYAEAACGVADVLRSAPVSKDRTQYQTTRT